VFTCGTIVYETNYGEFDKTDCGAYVGEELPVSVSGSDGVVAAGHSGPREDGLRGADWRLRADETAHRDSGRV